MIKSASQLKGKIKNLAKGDVRKAETYIRLYFMERLLERISISEYKERFVIKGGILASSLLGIDMRTTMDIDTTVRALPLTDADIQKFVNEICSIEIGDSVTFRITHTEQIMDDFDYPGVKVHLEGLFEGIRQPIKIDVSTDDVITPSAIEYNYKLMFEDRTIKLMTYNTETLLAEKMQTILARGIANTRRRDFYDVYMITTNLEFSWDTLAEAFEATCQKRDTMFSVEKADSILKLIARATTLKGNWERFRNKNEFAKELEWEIVNKQASNSIRKVLK